MENEAKDVMDKVLNMFKITIPNSIQDRFKNHIPRIIEQNKRLTVVEYKQPDTYNGYMSIVFLHMLIIQPVKRSLISILS